MPCSEHLTAQARRYRGVTRGGGHGVHDQASRVLLRERPRRARCGLPCPFGARCAGCLAARLHGRPLWPLARRSSRSSRMTRTGSSRRREGPDRARRAASRAARAGRRRAGALAAVHERLFEGGVDVYASSGVTDAAAPSATSCMSARTSSSAPSRPSGCSPSRRLDPTTAVIRAGRPRRDTRGAVASRL